MILIKILLIGINLYGGIYYEFHGDIYGVDTRFHNAQTETYIEKGHITLDHPSFTGTNAYYYFPIFHIQKILLMLRYMQLELKISL